MARLTVAGVGSLLVAMAVAATSAGPQTRAPQQPPPAQRPSEVEVVIRGDGVLHLRYPVHRGGQISPGFV